MEATLINQIRAELATGELIPYIGPAALDGVTEAETGAPIPADSDSLILALNGGKPMAPRLMFEFPRAAMNLELKKGRSFVERSLTEVYSTRNWSKSPFHSWLAGLSVPYVVDTNRDQQLLEAYSGREHTLILGVARIGGTDYRFKLFEFDGQSYVEKTLETANPKLPVLFKPLGAPNPEPHFIASDADFVDYITELMGGFAIPDFIKKRRVGKRYLVMGLRFTRDTERMILSELIHDAAGDAGWVLLPSPTDKERRFCEKKRLTIIEEDFSGLMA